MPGLAENFSVYLGDYGVKAFAILLLLINLREIGELFKYSKIKSIIVVGLLLFIYRAFHATSQAEQQLLPLISLLWLIIVYLSIKTKKHFEIFIFCLYVSSCIVLFSPGIERIFDFSRIGFSDSRSVNALTGIANHYIIYAQMAIISFYLSLYYFIKLKSKSIKFLLIIIITTNLIAIITSGSRGAILAFLISVIFLLQKNKKLILRNKFKFGLLFFVSVLVLFLTIPLDSIFLSFESVYTKSDKSSLKRLELYFFSLNSFYNAPLFGNGWDYIRLTKGLPAHTLILQLLAELGIVGLLLEFFIYNRLFSLFRSLKSKLFRYDKKSFYGITILLSLITALGVWSLFENIGFVFGTRQLYIVTALIMCFYKINYSRVIES
jgi:O-antigen ligase